MASDSLDAELPDSFEERLMGPAPPSPWGQIAVRGAAVVLVLFVCTLAFVPLYSIWIGFSSPIRLDWEGYRFGGRLGYFHDDFVDPTFWLFPILAVSSAAAVLAGRRGTALTFLGLLLGLFVLHYTVWPIVLYWRDLVPQRIEVAEIHRTSWLHRGFAVTFIGMRPRPSRATR